MAVTSMLELTREYYRLPVTLTVADVPIDPTTLPAQFAIMAQGVKPDDGDLDWLDAGWELAGTETRAIILVGDALADFVIVAPNVYDVYFRITDTPERPVRLVGQIKAT